MCVHVCARVCRPVHCNSIYPFARLWAAESKPALDKDLWNLWNNVKDSQLTGGNPLLSASPLADFKLKVVHFDNR